MESGTFARLMDDRETQASHDRVCPVMSQAIGEVLAFGIGVALSPLAVIAVVLMLVAPGGRMGATVFVASWAMSLGAVATVALLLADGANAQPG